MEKVKGSEYFPNALYVSTLDKSKLLVALFPIHGELTVWWGGSQMFCHWRCQSICIAKPVLFLSWPTQIIEFWWMVLPWHYQMEKTNQNILSLGKQNKNKTKTDENGSNILARYTELCIVVRCGRIWRLFECACVYRNDFHKNAQMHVNFCSENIGTQFKQ